MKRTIGWKITITYLIILVISFGLLGFLFNSLVRSFLIKEVQRNLEKDGKVLVAIYENLTVKQIENANTRAGIKLANRLFEGHYVIVDTDNNVILSSTNNIQTGSVITYPIVNSALKGKEGKGVNDLKNQEYVLVALPLNIKKDGIKGALVMFTNLKGVQQLAASIIQVLFRGFLIVLVPAFVLIIFLARSISKPIRLLETSARRLGERDFDTQISIHTGDELEQLSNSFNQMTRELKHYYLAQKRFLQNASHELKTPLMSIQGYAEGIKDGVLEGEEKEKGLEIIIEESTRLKNIVNELIYLSKLETMEEVYKFQTHNVGEIILECSEKMQNMADRKNVRINIGIPETPVIMKMDREKITQAFVNLFSNGIRFATTKLDVQLFVSPNQVHIEFNDDGTGFQEEEMASVFDRFYIGQKGETGLGLAITKAIIKKHGGEIKARNKNSGASITIDFPKKH